MKIQNISNYVYSNCETYPSLGILKSVFFLFSFLGIFTIIPSIVAKKFVAFGFLASIIIIYVISLLIFQRRCKVPYFILCPASKAVLGTFISLYFLFFTLWILEIQEKAAPAYVLLLVFSYIIILALLFAITITCVKKGVYRKTNKKRKKGINYTIIASCSSLGFFSAKILSDSFNKDIAIIISVLIFFGVVICGASGTTDFLKCYFILKYPVVSEQQWKKGAENLINHEKKMTAEKKFLLTIFLILLFLIIIGCFGHFIAKH